MNAHWQLSFLPESLGKRYLNAFVRWDIMDCVLWSPHRSVEACYAWVSVCCFFGCIYVPVSESSVWSYVPVHVRACACAWAWWLRVCVSVRVHVRMRMRVHVRVCLCPCVCLRMYCVVCNSRVLTCQNWYFCFFSHTGSLVARAQHDWAVDTCHSAFLFRSVLVLFPIWATTSSEAFISNDMQFRAHSRRGSDLLPACIHQFIIIIIIIINVYFFSFAAKLREW